MGPGEGVTSGRAAGGKEGPRAGEARPRHALPCLISRSYGRRTQAPRSLQPALSHANPRRTGLRVERRSGSRTLGPGPPSPVVTVCKAGFPGDLSGVTRRDDG